MFGGKKLIAILPAAGKGERMGVAHSKLLCKVDGQEILFKSVNALSACGFFDQIIIPGRESDFDIFSKVLQGISSAAIKLIVGGQARQDSVRNALDYISANCEHPEDALILIHDAARCYVSYDLIERCLLAALQHKAVTAAIDCVDTVYAADNNDQLVLPLLQRNSLRAIQTPQVFDFNLLMQAHKLNPAVCSTDDAGMVAQIAPVFCVQGDRRNIKVTTAEDLNVI